MPPQWQTASGLPRYDLTTREAGGSPKEGVTGMKKGAGVRPAPVVMHTNAVTAPSGLSDGAYDAPHGAGVFKVRVPRPSLVELHREKGLMIIAQQLLQETWRGLPRCSRVTSPG